MNAKLYISKTEISLDFESQYARDAFYENLAANRSGGFAPQDAAQKVGERSIRFDQSKFAVGYVWTIQFR